MTAIPWRDAIDTFKALAVEPALGLLCDLDGTLAHLTPTASEAEVTLRNRQALLALKETLPLLAVVSGRRASIVYEKVHIPGLVYVGNHGMDQWIDGQVVVAPQAAPYRDAIVQVMKELAPLEEPGSAIEDKDATISFHYRRTADPEAFAAKAAPFIQSVASRHGLETFTGKMIFEVRPPVEIDKGVALTNLAEQYHLKAALFLGDDVTDLAAMHAARRLRDQGLCSAWSVGVQSEDAPLALAEAADFFVEGVEGVEELLEWLLSERKASST